MGREQQQGPNPARVAETSSRGEIQRGMAGSDAGDEDRRLAACSGERRTDRMRGGEKPGRLRKIDRGRRLLC